MSLCTCNCRHLARMINKYDYSCRPDCTTNVKRKDINEEWRKFSNRYEYDGRGLVSYLDTLSLSNIQDLYEECSSCKCCDRHRRDFPSLNNYLTRFISEEDEIVFDEQNVTREDVRTFVLEMKEYFKLNWRGEFLKELEILNSGYINDLNKVLGYPSWGGYQILDDSFTGDIDLKPLSKKSIELLGYFYGIHLR